MSVIRNIPIVVAGLVLIAGIVLCILLSRENSRSAVAYRACLSDVAAAQASTEDARAETATVRAALTEQLAELEAARSRADSLATAMARNVSEVQKVTRQRVAYIESAQVPSECTEAITWATNQAAELVAVWRLE